MCDIFVVTRNRVRIICFTLGLISRRAIICEAIEIHSFRGRPSRFAVVSQNRDKVGEAQRRPSKTCRM